MYKAQINLRTAFLGGVVILTFPASVAAQATIPFDEVRILAELNDTDGDLGFHALIDGEPWKSLQLRAPDGRVLINVANKGAARQQGLTEFFFESAEPVFDELSPNAFFARFPEGNYRVTGRTVEGERLRSLYRFSHTMPSPPGLNGLNVSGIPFAQDCDLDPPVIAQPTIIDWQPVRVSHPEVGPPNRPVSVAFYEVVIEQEDIEATVSALLPPEQTSFTVPTDFLALGEEFKYEVLVREENGNQTATESCFATTE